MRSGPRATESERERARVALRVLDAGWNVAYSWVTQSAREDRMAHILRDERLAAQDMGDAQD